MQGMNCRAFHAFVSHEITVDGKLVGKNNDTLNLCRHLGRKVQLVAIYYDVQAIFSARILCEQCRTQNTLELLRPSRQTSIPCVCLRFETGIRMNWHNTDY